jgi:hypothetical protein
MKEIGSAYAIMLGDRCSKIEGGTGGFLRYASNEGNQHHVGLSKNEPTFFANYLLFDVGVA